MTVVERHERAVQLREQGDCTAVTCEVRTVVTSVVISEPYNFFPYYLQDPRRDLSNAPDKPITCSASCGPPTRPTALYHAHSTCGRDVFVA
eukprot:6688778-Prymnesium_polylepis.3